MKIFFFILGLIIAGFLAYSYVPNAAQLIENKVTENLTAELVPQGLPADVQIDVEGRDVTLSGLVETEADKSKFIGLSQQTLGVISVQSDLNVPMAPPIIVVEKPIEDEAVFFDPFDDEPLFDFLADDYQDEADDALDEMQHDIAIGVENATDAVEEIVTEAQEMIEEPAVPLAPEITDLDEVVVEVPEVVETEVVETVEVQTKKTSTECQAEITNLIVGKRINFETGVAKIEKDSLPLLDSIVKNMTACSDMALHIHGHTDNIGDDQLNRKLSHARAKSVGLYLLKQGVTQRIKIFGHGVDQPIASNDSEVGREKNRRIEFTVADLDDSVAGDDEETKKTTTIPSSINTRTIIAQ